MRSSEQRRQRVCIICGNPFLCKRAEHKGLTCSKECLGKLKSKERVGRKQSPETVAKRSQALRNWHQSNPELAANKRDAVTKGIRQWLSVPENFEARSKRSSDRMKKLHADPEWQKVRNERSSRTMKRTWESHRDFFTKIAMARYLKSAQEGVGICSPAAISRRKAAAKWIMQEAQAALHSETEYDEKFNQIKERLRIEKPYDGPMTDSDYYDYLRWIGLETCNDPELREMADTFMSTAIPRFAAEWKKKKEAEK